MTETDPTPTLATRPFVLYVRKSEELDERQAQSLENQMSVGREHARRLGIDNLIVKEDAHSAKEPGRPVFDSIIAAADRGEIAGLIAWHPDRLSRNEIDAAAVTYRVRKGILPALHFVSYHFMNSNEGIMMLQNALSVSQYSSSKLSVDVKRGIHNKVVQGWYPHWTPLGYKNNTHETKGLKSISRDPERFELLRRIWTLLLTGLYSAEQLRRMANEEWGLRTPVGPKGKGGNPVARSTFYRMISNVFYAGYFVHNGILYAGRHEPMVSVEEFNRAQELVWRRVPRGSRNLLAGVDASGREPGKPIDTSPAAGEHNGIGRTTKSHAYTGLIRCPTCGGPLTITITTKPSGRSYRYYHCQSRISACGKHALKEGEFTQRLDEQLIPMELDDEFYAWALEDVERGAEALLQKLQSIREQQGRTELELARQADELLDLRLKNLITDEEYTKKKNLLTSQRANLPKVPVGGEKDASALSAVEKEEAIRHVVEANRNVANFMYMARQCLQQPDDRTKRLVATNLGSNYVWQGKKVLMELNPMLSGPAKDYPGLKARRDLIKLDKNLSESEKQGQLALVRRAWSHTWDANQTLALDGNLRFPGLPADCVP